MVRDLVNANVAFSGLEIWPTSLEEAFLTITAGGDRPAIAGSAATEPITA